MLHEPLPHPGEFGEVVIPTAGQLVPALPQEGGTRHSEVASMTLRVS